VGRFTEKKGPFLTLLAFARAHRELPDLSLTMVGDGPLLQPSRLLARALGIEDAVCFEGVKAPLEVAALLRTARAFVQHSMVAGDGDSEGTPVAVLEAGAAGLPVIATFHAGIPDVIEHEETGLLVQEGDVEGMAAHMVRLGREPETAQRMGAKGRARVATGFSLERNLEGLRDVLRTCVAERSSTR
jgi:colanic acid/amylovoran biosynthesis glycosyltransferase